ncbi:hypothetical protein FRC12_019764 [Ceratobasidium sp. 428]|nr:hypothetical protein FRC12_019764 [Ceratobasidium sp. 428]
MSNRAKQRPNVFIPPARRPSSQNTSEPDPGTPVNPGATPAVPEATPPQPSVPAPKTPENALTLLASHGLVQKGADITPSVITNMLYGLANFPKVIANGHNPIITAIALLVPLAMEGANLAREDLESVKAKVESLEGKVDKVLGLVENPMSLEEDVDGKLDKMLSGITNSSAKAEAAEQAANTALQKLTTFIETQSQAGSQAWSRVTAKNSRSHREPTPGAPRPPQSHTQAAPKELASDAKQRAFSQAATILIQPNTGAAGSTMDDKDERALLKWIEGGMFRTWAQLTDAGHLNELGLKSAPHVRFSHATRLPSGGVLFELADRHHAALLSTVWVAKALEGNLGNFTCRGQRAEVLLQSAPVEVNPEDPEFLRALERDNQIEAESVLNCSWVKPVRRRHPQQIRAVIKVSLRSQVVADSLIARDGCLNGEPVQFRQIEEEPTRCLKCQKYGHRVAKCTATRDYCSQCGDDHRSSACPDRRRRYCVSCNFDKHASWFRGCPAYERERVRLNQRKPENCRKHFDPERVDPPNHDAEQPAPPVAAVAPAAPATPVTVAPAIPVPATPALPNRTLTEIIREDGTVPVSVIPAYLVKRSSPPPSPPAVETVRHISPPWDSESKHGDDSADEQLVMAQISLAAPTPSLAHLERFISPEEEVPFTPPRPTTPSPRYPLSVYRVPARARSVSVSTVSSASSASTVTVLTRRMASVPGGFDSSP